ncbi:MAG: FAD-dependent oxidoreductase [Kiritimatiellae bacterium]|nr:FAD-dependent oxidoreductase [Kiritimatiellia bacterium]
MKRVFPAAMRRQMIRSAFAVALAFLMGGVAVAAAAVPVLIEAEAFSDRGGWSLDSQSVEQMGSPYLLAHGMGVPVADAVTTVRLPQLGAWRVWVRTRDWTPDYEGEKPGRFQVWVNGSPLAPTFGVEPPAWGWVDGGVIEPQDGMAEIRLHDLTGFEGRCDAVCLQDPAEPPPPASGAALARWRAEQAGETEIPTQSGSYDLVVVGGGIAGTCAAIAAAEEGLTVALIQDRFFLGGNASGEIRVKTQGEVRHRIVQSVANTKENGNAYAHVDDTNRMAVVARYPGITPFTGWRAYHAQTNGARRIVAVDARRIDDGRCRRFTAPLFVDATGDGWIGYWAGASYRMGREAKAEYGETLAQTVADTCTMGNSLMWTSKLTESDQPFPAVPWALPVSGSRSATSGNWQWEAGLGPTENTITDAEMLRDRLFRAIYGSFWTAKQNAAHAKRVLEWVPFNAGKRESRRIIGDYVVKQQDVEGSVWFEDAIGTSTWSIDLHYYSGDSGYIAATKQVSVARWYMPYRALCCRDVPNLFLAGRCASFTHVAFGSSRVMNTGGQMGVAVGYAASLCKRYGCEPRDIYRSEEKTEELQRLIGGTWPTRPLPDRPSAYDGIVDNPDAEVSGDWQLSTSEPGRYGPNYLHNKAVPSASTWVAYRPSLPEFRAYELQQMWNGNSSRASNVKVVIAYAEGTVTNIVNMTSPGGTWASLGTWRFPKKGAFATILTEGTTSGKYVIADAFRWRAYAGETIVDNADAAGFTTSGSWVTSSYNSNRYGADYVHNGKKGAADIWAKFTPTLSTACLYRVSMIWNHSSDRATEAAIEVTHAAGTSRVTVDMTRDSGAWTAIGEWRFTAGTAGSVKILTEGNAGKTVIADAVRFTPVTADSDDRDGNGLPDRWEREHFLMSGGVDPLADPDGDGLTNADECLAGSDPLDGKSVFSIRALSHAPQTAQGRVVTLSWPSVQGRRYTVLRAGSLGEDFVPYQTEVAATPPLNTLRLPPDDADSAFYRVRVNDE